MPSSRLTDVDDYIAAAAPRARARLRELRQIVRRAAPGASELISYRMPAFKLGRVFFFFGAFAGHIGVYPPVRDARLARELAPFRGPKGNLRFLFDEPLPRALIARVARALAKEIGAAPAGRRTPARRRAAARGRP